jgi:hypothetical protein
MGRKPFKTPDGHVRTRHHAPETNGVVERFNQTLKAEHLHRHEIADALELSATWPSPADHTYPSPKVSKILDAGHHRRLRDTRVSGCQTARWLTV